MKNKILKIVLGIVIGIIAIVTIVFIVTKLSEKKPSDAVVSFVENLQNGELEIAKSYTSDNTFSAFGFDTENDDLEMIKYYFKYLDVNVVDITKSKSEAIVRVELNNKNLKTILQKYIQKALELAMSSLGSSEKKDGMEAELLEYFKSKFESEEIDTVTTTVDIVLNKVDKEWKVVVTEELRDAILPGLSDINNLYSMAA